MTKEKIVYKEVELNGRTIRYRKWKVKDKLELDKIQPDTDENKLENDLKKREIFVYNCLENPDTPLDLEEYNYILALIRDYSIHNVLEYTLECEKCGKEFDIGMTSAQIVQKIDAHYGEIIVGDDTFLVDNITNKNDYERDVMSALTLSERFIIDFAYHIKKINDKEVKPKEVIDFLENLDVDLYEEIFKKYETMRFSCNLDHKCECPYCHNVDEYEFSQMTNFFPESWNI